MSGRGDRHGQRLVHPARFVLGYALAWTGHVFFEKNRPATFRHALYRFAEDWAMFRDILMRSIEF
jgi:hypothetical protein